MSKAAGPATEITKAQVAAKKKAAKQAAKDAKKAIKLAHDAEKYVAFSSLDEIIFMMYNKAAVS